MGLFIGTHQNKLDAKGRVSVPAPFRSVLKKMSGAGEGALVAPLVLRPSHQHPCIEGWTEKGFEALSAPLDQYDSSAPNTIISPWRCSATPARWRPTRKAASSSAELVAYAGLTDSAVFIGASKTFQIWEPEAGARRLAEAKAAVRAAQMTLKAGAA